jgi:hypothetical protein
MTGNDCKGNYDYYIGFGWDFECGYSTTIECEECKYSGHGGRKDPEAKCNQLEEK